MEGAILDFEVPGILRHGGDGDEVVAPAQWVHVVVCFGKEVEQIEF